MNHTGDSLASLKVERMKLLYKISVALGRALGCLAWRNRRNFKIADNSSEQIMDRLKSLDCNFAPSIIRIRSLGSRLEEIANQAREAEADIFAAFNCGKSVHARVGDLKLVFDRYQKCFSELSQANSTLAWNARLYVERLDQLLGKS
jgi:hypothetical protein